MHRVQEVMARWPGKSVDANGLEHPAILHMLDVAAVAETLLIPLPCPAPLKSALILLTALHDLGKINADFRQMLHGGRSQGPRHWQVTEVLLQRNDDLLAARLGGRWQRRLPLYAATAGHHGKPPDLSETDQKRSLTWIGKDALDDARATIAVFLDLWPEASLDSLQSEAEAKRLSWWLPGLVTTADWIGSNTGWFPAHPPAPLPGYLAQTRARAKAAVTAAGLAGAPLLTGPLFDFALRPMQQACADIPLPEGPMLAVIEDETGAGKTEAALILAHGKAGLSVTFRDLVAGRHNAPEDVSCTPWLADNRRRALLADIGVGTIDQALLAALPTKFHTLRHYALSSKLLIVDEVHELGEPYIGAVLERLLALHRQAGGSAILLTATLPLAQRARLLAVYQGASDDPAYPALTLAGGAARRDLPQVTGPRGPVRVQRLGDQAEAVALLAGAAGQGAACVWVRNAVDDAIAAVEALRAAGVQADLLHARFALVDRKRIETAMLARFGKAGQGRGGAGSGGHAGAGILAGSGFRRDGQRSGADGGADPARRAVVAA